MAESTHQESGSQRYVLDSLDADSECATPLDDSQIGDSPLSFQYCTLPRADSIRLVKIISIHPEIECEIEVANLSDTPTYEALSYCWGPPEELVPITCNGKLFEVSPSLRHGLLRLYEYSKTTRNDWFWIDQICINQEKDLERTHQVRLMNKIYSSSRRTVIWLPLEEPTAVAAKSLVLDYHKCLVARGEIRADDEERENIVEEVYNRTPIATIPSREDDRWPALGVLLRLPWFRRVWVIQEVVLSTQPAVILCGTQSLLWSVLYQTIRWMHIHTLEVDYCYGMAEVHNLSVIGARAPWEDGTDVVSWDLQSLLSLSQDSSATIPNDQVFALLGLCKDTREPGNWPVELNPDHSRPQTKVFMSVTRYSILQTCNLDILSLVDVKSSASDGGYPSWVPSFDFRRRRVDLRISGIIINSGHKMLKTLFFNASFGLNPVIDDATVPEILRLRGTRVDTAILLCKSFVYEDIRDSSVASMKDSTRLCSDLRAMLEFCQKHLPHVPIMELRRAFFLATTGGLTLEVEDALDEPLIHFETFLGIQEDYTTEVGHVPESRSDPSRYTFRLGCMVCRRVFVTSHGKIGLGPDTMEPNDIIAVLFGSNFPSILRPMENGQWRFIGVCYIHGLMKGEAVQGDGAREENHEWFELV